MTDHIVKRWTLTGGYITGLVAPAPDITVEEMMDADDVIAVREDRITAADVEAVAQWLYGYSVNTRGQAEAQWPVLADPEKAVWLANARELLALVLGGDG